MYCPKCACEFVEWLRKCPCCRVPLAIQVDLSPPRKVSLLPYEELVSTVIAEEGEVGLIVNTTDVVQYRRMGWARRMRGNWDGVPVELESRSVGMERLGRHLWRRTACAWVERLEGHIGGHRLILKATAVHIENAAAFAWMKQMTGECGANLHAKLITTKVGRDHKHGFAWEEQGVLVLSRV